MPVSQSRVKIILTAKIHVPYSYSNANMPKMNGVEFLKAVKADQRLKNIPIIALTTSKDGGDIEKCFQLGVAGYTVKPVDYKQFVKAMAIINLYWMLNEMPGECE